MNNEKALNALNKLIEVAKDSIDLTREFAKEMLMLNEQVYLDFEDYLNEISNKDPNE